MMDETTEQAPSLSHSQFLRIAMEVLSRKAARWCAMFMSFTLFGAACWWPNWGRLTAAAAFTILVHVPLWIRKEG